MVRARPKMLPFYAAMLAYVSILLFSTSYAVSPSGMLFAPIGNGHLNLALNLKPAQNFKPVLTINPNPAYTTQSVTITATCTPSTDICEIDYPSLSTAIATGKGKATYTYNANSLPVGTRKYYYAYDKTLQIASAGQSLTITNKVASTNAATSSATPLPTPAPQAIQACTLYGNSNYTNDWLPINYLVIIIGFMIIAVLYAIGRILPPKTRSAIIGMTKVEMTQLLISALIIVTLMFFSTATCNISSSISQQLTGTSLGPFTYADYYIGNLSMNTGLKLLTNIYSDSISFSIDARVYSYLASELSGKIGTPSIKVMPGVTVSIDEGYDLSIGYYLIADLYMALFSPLLVITIGMLFLQYLALPLIKLTAFALLLPVAIIIRSVAYTGAGGSGLRNVANAILAIAVALYLIYPLTIALDAYMVHWIFSVQNPLYPYLNMGFTLTQLPSTFFSSAASSATTSLPGGLAAPPDLSLISGVGSLGLTGIYDPYTPITISNEIVNLMSQFIFVGVILFALNIAITMAFAMSLAKALNSGIEGAAAFWSNL
ncbi:MAG: hypothetical protein QXW10_01200 [Candidatus Micrarchaeaceae archaeon]